MSISAHRVRGFPALSYNSGSGIYFFGIQVPSRNEKFIKQLATAVKHFERKGDAGWVGFGAWGLWFLVNNNDVVPKSISSEVVGHELARRVLRLMIVVSHYEEPDVSVPTAKGLALYMALYRLLEVLVNDPNAVKIVGKESVSKNELRSVLSLTKFLSELFFRYLTGETDDASLTEQLGKYAELINMPDVPLKLPDVDENKDDKNDEKNNVFKSRFATFPSLFP